MKEYQVQLMLGAFKVVNFGETNGVVMSKSPMQAIKDVSPFELEKIVKIDNVDINKYRRIADVVRVMNDKGKEYYYAVYRK